MVRDAGQEKAGPQNPEKRRIHSMDELRGFAVLCMIFYHGFYTLAYLYGIDWGMALLRFFMPAEPFFAALFILISGVSSDLSRSNLKRGLKLLAVALAVTLVTGLIVPSEIITFGILHFLSICMILFGLCKKQLDKLPFSWVWIALCALAYFFTMNITRGYLGIGAFSLPLPQVWYEQSWLFPFGICSSSFRSSDYFPLFPWIFVFLAGTMLGRFAAQGRFPAFLYPSRIPALSWMGRHALILYIVHQPVIYGAAWIIDLCLSR